ncbi:bifunctional UDP-N-acetylglucosamine diphosphorylase/glucosamine-1-phosphate N-acetyltransferase GlmU [Nitratifractor sp.]|uniref:bifunctional UDP-N-acetylglucosamine diphosphorylase/glucosamine-1-phosphate N-acetyltransferase GlmU n=1 Tax=Nitratifractor sp. TaxID=2268144 RepID=UPI0025EBA1CE|nr:bifunctional UDP-N-acetylglucosamine diphosphorylase/glucosamine-1-phosphate N-acetyltransferase GlmU [Nitratifractor sp.]
MSVSVVILAAGKGTRMKSKTPKVLHAISGKPMLFHAIDAAEKISDDITIILHHQFDRIKEAIEKEYSKVRFHRQDAENYPGTGGALRGIDFRHERVLILNGDMPLVTTASLLRLTDSGGDIAMSVIDLADPSGYGRVVIEGGEVREIVEEKDCTPEQRLIHTVNAGVYCVRRELLERYIPRLSNDNAQQEYYLTDIVKMAVDEGRHVKPVFVEEEEFKGVNSRVDLAHAEEIMQRRIRRYWMMEGVTMRLPETIYIDCRAEFLGECEIESGVQIHGRSRIENAHIKAHSVIEEAVIRDGSVGPMARIRPGSNLSHTQIGNFVEVKKSVLKGVKAGHLSYLGDSEIGEGTNIGAGTITCNYDGKAKYKTIIGKNVFVGSDTQLVAPVTIEDETIIAAGSTVTRDVPSGALAISRVPLKIVEGFYRKFFNKGRV